MEDLRDGLVFHEDWECDGVRGFWWPKTDSGSWDGPHRDWDTSHKSVVLGAVDRFDVVVQAGGNMGLYPKLLASRFKTVYTFEPYPLSFMALSLNVSESNVVKVNAALWDRNVLTGIKVDSVTNLGTNKTDPDRPDRSIPCFTIDQLALESCDLIWLDVESAESRIITGARSTIERFLPTIAVESLNKEARAYLEGLGYVEVGRSIADTVLKVVR
jgi:FkbM family methyltransferase